MLYVRLNRKRYGHWSISFLLLVLLGCSDKDMVNGPTSMPLAIPSNFPQPVYDLAANPITKEGFELGRKLFYDGQLSRDGTISCGACHLQANAFTHHGHDVSHGIDDRLGVRNSPPVMNLAWSKFFFWDGGVFNLDLQPLGPIENPVEMDEHVSVVIDKLKKDPAYPTLFRKAFGSAEITTPRMLQAMSQFMLQCVSANSKYDKVVRKEGAVFTAEEEQGFALFKANCSTCHSSDLFTDNAFHNNGLVPSRVNDKGRFLITLDEADAYLFKTPSLRNVALTGPYMHDGRFLTLEAVLEHYHSGVNDNPTLDPLLKKNGKPGIPLSKDEQQKIIAFLKTLTDEQFIRDPKLAEQ